MRKCYVIICGIVVFIIISLGVCGSIFSKNFNNQILQVIEKGADNVSDYYCKVEKLVDVIKLDDTVICIYTSNEFIVTAYLDEIDDGYLLKKAVTYKATTDFEEDDEFTYISDDIIFSNLYKCSEKPKIGSDYSYKHYSIEINGEESEYWFTYRFGQRVNYPIYVHFSTDCTMRLVKEDFLSCFIDEDNVIYIAKETDEFVDSLPLNYDLNKLYDEIKTLEQFKEFYKTAEIESKKLDYETVLRINDLLVSVNKLETIPICPTPYVRYSIGNSHKYSFTIDYNIFPNVEYYGVEDSKYSKEEIQANTALREFFELMNDLANWDFPNPYDR